MSSISAIEWTDATWNPTRGCTKISPGCKHCYAERFAERFRGVKGHPYEHGFDLRLVPDALDLPLRWKKPRRIFVNSMSDLFHEDVPNEFIAEVFETMIKAKHHTFQILTKRAERLVAFRDWWCPGRFVAFPDNVWLGVSAEDQKRWDERVQYLGQTPAAVRFVSAEPLLGPIDCGNAFDAPPEGSPYSPIDWVIVGGESGPGARPMRVEWARSIVEQCQAADVKVFVKQLGAKPEADLTEEARQYIESDEPVVVPLKLKDRKGGDPMEWPSDLRVRQFPEVR